MPLVLIFAYVFNWGLSGIWWGIVAANLTAAMVSFLWAKREIFTLVTQR
jgi:Na+-driven multidrug efflux pump